MIPNLPEFTQAYFGILYAGCTVVPLNVLLSAPEVQYHLEDSRARLLIAHPLFEAPAKAGAAAAGVPVVWAAGAGADTVAALAAAPPIDALHADAAHRHRGDPLHVGHHGQAEGRRAHPLEPVRELRGRACRSSLPLASRRRRARDAAAVPLVRADLHPEREHRRRAARFTLLPRFTPDDAFAIMERDRVTLFAGVPDDVLRAAPPRGPRARPLGAALVRLRAARAMPVEVMNAFEAKFGVEILEGYGLSETSPVASFNMLGPPAHARLDRLPGLGRRDGDPRREGPAGAPTASAARSASAATT